MCLMAMVAMSITIRLMFLSGNSFGASVNSSAHFSEKSATPKQIYLATPEKYLLFQNLPSWTRCPMWTLPTSSTATLCPS